MSDKTVSLTNRRVNQSLRTRKRADDIHLKKQKVDLDIERRHCQHQLSLQQKGLQEKLQKLRLRQKDTSTFISQPGTSEAEKALSTTLHYHRLLEPIHDLVDPYPVTFDKTGKKPTPKHGLVKTKGSADTPKFPDILKTSSSATIPFSRNSKSVLSQSFPPSTRTRNVNNKIHGHPRHDVNSNNHEPQSLKSKGIKGRDHKIHMNLV